MTAQPRPDQPGQPNDVNTRHLGGKRNRWQEPVNDFGFATQRLHCIDCGEEKGSGHGAAVGGAWDHAAHKDGWVQSHAQLNDAQISLRAARRVRPGRPADPQKVHAAKQAAAAEFKRQGVPYMESATGRQAGPVVSWDQFGGTVSGGSAAAPPPAGEPSGADAAAQRRADRIRDRLGR
jgi:hypothetical protein